MVAESMNFDFGEKFYWNQHSRKPWSANFVIWFLSTVKRNKNQTDAKLEKSAKLFLCPYFCRGTSSSSCCYWIVLISLDQKSYRNHKKIKNTILKTYLIVCIEKLFEPLNKFEIILKPAFHKSFNWNDLKKLLFDRKKCLKHQMNDFSARISRK